MNRQLFCNILEHGYFPNLMFYGPPGTGKTTTIINLINEYQQKYYGKSKGTVIHLNASDERGIDIIRNQINQFVKSKNLFEIGFKFVILDEVDYMTKNAQQALKYLLQGFNNSVRFCLICNYISKIDEGLQNEFIKLKFNQLPKEDIIKFLTYISNCENLNLSNKAISCIQKLYNSDIRSMINFMQSNQNLNVKSENGDYDYNIKTDNFIILDNVIWEELFIKISNKENIEELYAYIQMISIKYNIDKKNIIKDFLNYIIHNHKNIINTNFLNFVENLMHSQNNNNKNYIYYSLSQLSSFI
jgi:replication factor C subunit 3/5